MLEAALIWGGAACAPGYRPTVYCQLNRQLDYLMFVWEAHSTLATFCMFPSHRSAFVLVETQTPGWCPQGHVTPYFLWNNRKLVILRPPQGNQTFNSACSWNRHNMAYVVGKDCWKSWENAYWETISGQLNITQFCRVVELTSCMSMRLNRVYHRFSINLLLWGNVNQCQ